MQEQSYKNSTEPTFQRRRCVLLSAEKRSLMLSRYDAQYRQLTAELAGLGYVLQGTLIEDRRPCGKPACRCHTDPAAWHGPYRRWTWKAKAKTQTVYLSKEQAEISRPWMNNNHRLDYIIRQMRYISLRVARLHGLPARKR